MIEYAQRFMNEIGFGEDATDALLADLEKIYSHSEARAELEGCVAMYKESIDLDYRVLLDKIDRAAELTGVHRYSAELLLYVCLSEYLREVYRQRGVSDRIWFDSMCDLKWKLWECQAVKGMHGSFVADWFYRFFNMTRFALGRLQFETEYIKDDCTVYGKPVKPGMKAVFIHIPRTLTPLTRESRLDAYRQAADMFRGEMGDQPVLFACHSWLLSREIPSMLKEGANLKGFIEDFDIIKYETAKEGDYGEAWRLFDMDYTGNIDDYPEDSSLRRNYKKYLKDGGVMGCGLGLFFEEDVLGE